MSVDHSGKGYAPLPQSISNTDTEDEDERLAPPNDVIHKEHDETTITEPTTLHKNGLYYPLDETRNLANRARNGQSTLRCYRDDIPIMVIEGSDDQNDLWKRRDMSPIRRFCLVASVLLCIATIIVFLYVLPCDDSVVCPPMLEPKSSVSWDKTLQGVEMHGPISVIPGSPYNLVFLLRGQRYGGNGTSPGSQREISTEGNGVISMQGNSGLPLWKWQSLKRLPTDVDCITVDTDRSGKPDCIVVGDQGLLASIEPTAGTAHWSSTTHTFSKLPVILPDVDADGIDDFLSVDVSSDRGQGLVILSGGNGQMLGRYSTPGNCSFIDIYNLVFNGSVTYVCHDSSGKRVTKSISYKKLLNGSTLSQGHKSFAAKSSSQPRVFESLKRNYEKFVWKPTPYHRLSVENEGTCPGEQCRVTVNLTLQKSTNQSLTVWDHASTNAFASKPAFLVMQGKPYTTGFAIKFWQWSDYSSDQKETSHIKERKLTERVLIVFVNYTDVQVMNASQSDVIQLCHGSDCQPNLSLRTRFSSIAVAYIGGDGLPELISYWSSYDTESSRALMSKVQVVKLDSITSLVSHGAPYSSR